jgi:FkbM family methyltransferase
MSFSIKLGNFLFKNAYPLYKPMYVAFKKRQDKFEIELLQKYIKKGDVVLDIGANIGFYTRIISELIGAKGKVHCFEPDVINFDRLFSFCYDLKNVALNQKAVGPKTEKIKIYTSKMLNVDHRTYKHDNFDTESEIDAVSIDDYLKENKKVDFIKMDIQGFEMSAIKGMDAVLKENQNLKMISEFWPYGLKLNGGSGMDYYQHLKNLGFICYLFEENSLNELTEAKVKEMDTLGEEHYFNIFASKTKI